MSLWCSFLDAFTGTSKSTEALGRKWALRLYHWHIGCCKKNFSKCNLQNNKYETRNPFPVFDWKGNGKFSSGIRWCQGPVCYFLKWAFLAWKNGVSQSFHCWRNSDCFTYKQLGCLRLGFRCQLHARQWKDNNQTSLRWQQYNWRCMQQYSWWLLGESRLCTNQSFNGKIYGAFYIHMS